MKRYIEVRPQRSLKSRVVVYAVLALVVYALIAHPAEAAEIGHGVAEAIVSFLQSL